MAIYAVYAIVEEGKRLEVYNPYEKVLDKKLVCTCVSFQEASGIDMPFDEWERQATRDEFEEVMSRLEWEYSDYYYADVLEIYPPKHMIKCYCRRNGDIVEYYFIDDKPFDVVFSIIRHYCGVDACEPAYRDSYKVNAGILREEDYKRVKRQFMLMYLSEPCIVIDPRPVDCVSSVLDYWALGT